MGDPGERGVPGTKGMPVRTTKPVFKQQTYERIQPLVFQFIYLFFANQGTSGPSGKVGGLGPKVINC